MVILLVNIDRVFFKEEGRGRHLPPLRDYLPPLR